MQQKVKICFFCINYVTSPLSKLYASRVSYSGESGVKIQTKLIAALMTAGVLLVVAMLLLIRWAVNEGMLEYVNQKQQQKLQPAVAHLAEVYRSDGGWQALRENPSLLRSIMMDNYAGLAGNQSRRMSRTNRIERMQRRQQTYGNISPRKHSSLERKPIATLFDQERKPLVGILKYQDAASLVIKADDKIVGWLGVPKLLQISEGFELQFVEQQHKVITYIALIIFVVGVLIAIPLARHFIVPIKHIVNTTFDLTQGKYGKKKLLVRKDELGELAKYINDLSFKLKSIEDSRKHWLANISHELRTPVTILRGELEAIVDGIRKANKDNVRAAHTEVIHLQKLIEDLHELTIADIGALQYQKTDVNFNSLLSFICDTHIRMIERCALQLKVDIPDTPVVLWADPNRLLQLFNNLLNNCEKYCNKGSTIGIRCLHSDGYVTIIVEDSSQGVPDNELGRLFDHLHRVEQSRSRNIGGSGLGLAICKKIVEAHDGEIHAEKSSLGGLAIVSKFPESVASSSKK